MTTQPVTGRAKEFTSLISRIDRAIVAAGYPTEDGLYFLWSGDGGWPALHVVHVQTGAGMITWSHGARGTDRARDIPQMFSFSADSYLGSSRITPEAVAHWEALTGQTSEEICAFLAGAGR